ncbi:hypothetical protein RUM43_001373 [Polyplax serrata]|uniref:Sugar phosphate exchanger 3 n=1 Tax=Polyplax serrata TaxID=468196 RepID=A0AAN8SHM6_POLSC
MVTKDLPIGVKLVKVLTRRCQWNFNKDLWNKGLILVLTFLSYMSYHFTRKPISVVKNVLHPNCSNALQSTDKFHSGDNCSGWAPFDGDNAGRLFGALDSAFLFAYAFAMFISGVVAERVNLRYFLSMGMLLSGVLCYMFGLAKSLNIHSLPYFIIVQILMGVFQTTGWPAVVTIVGHWFGKGKRGLIFGIWNSHTSLGNIIGTLIAGYYVETNWGYSFIVPGFLMAVFGFFIFLFLVVHPEDVGCSSPESVNRRGINVSSYMSLPQKDDSSSENDSEEDEEDTKVVPSVPYHTGGSATERSPILINQNEKAIGFLEALKIPGVVEFSMSLFFSKLVSYTFLYWLPYYISSSTSFSPSLSAELSTLFDVGGIAGAIAAGTVTDATNMSATVCVIMLLLAVPTMFVYEAYGNVSKLVNISLLLVTGALVNGPYALITTTVSAELGTHESLQGNSKALATVTAIIDGTGSIGAAVGPLIAGLVSPTGWDKVFYFLMASDIAALTLLIRLTIKEFYKIRGLRHRPRIFP